jgi:spore germination protein YaaH
LTTIQYNQSTRTRRRFLAAALFGCTSLLAAAGCAARASSRADPPLARPSVTATLPPIAASDPTPEPSPTTGVADALASVLTVVRDPTPTAIGTATPTTGRVLLAYYVPYDPTSWASLVAHANQIDVLATQSIALDACGGLTAQDDRTLRTLARAHGISVLASVTSGRPPINHPVLTDPTTRDRAIQALTGYVVAEGYAGLDLDLEGIGPDDREALTGFVGRLADALHRHGRRLTMALPAKTSDRRTGFAGPYDYAGLAPHLDLATLMCYDYSWAGGPPGAIAPYDWIDGVIAYATSQIPARKVLLGIGWYGYDWNVTSGARATALQYPRAAALARAYQATIGFDPVARAATFQYRVGPGDPPPPTGPPLPPLQHDVRISKPPACAVARPSPRPSAVGHPTARPTPTRVGQHVVWLADAATLQAELTIATRYATAGLAAWRLGQEDPAVWPVLQAWHASAPQG